MTMTTRARYERALYRARLARARRDRIAWQRALRSARALVLRLEVEERNARAQRGAPIGPKPEAAAEEVAA